MDGHWGYTDQGWTWVSNEDHGWATYHYGRWALIANSGWVWVPGNQWGPAWVSWRTPPRYSPGTTVTTVVSDDDSDYIGWAPLPPEAVFDVSVGFTGRVDEQFEIGPANYCFVPTRSFTAPVLTAVIVPVNRNVVFISRTVNVTNVSRVDRGGAAVYFNRGPEVTTIERVVQHPVQRLTIERQPASVYTQNRAGAHFADQVHGNSLQVVAPQIAATGTFQGGAPSPQGSGPRPQQVKGELKQVKRDSGWEQPGADAKAVQSAREQIKREAAQAPKQAAAPDAVAPNSSAAGGRPPANPDAPAPAGTANRPTGGTQDPRSPATRGMPNQPANAPENLNVPPTAVPQTRPADASTIPPTPVPHRESEAAQAHPPGAAPAPEKEVPRREQAKPQEQPRQRPPAETQRREPNRPSEPAAETRRDATKPESAPPKNPEPQSAERPPKPDASRPEQSERAKPQAEKPRQPADENARKEEASRDKANPPAEPQRKPEPPKKPQPTPVPN